MGTLCELVESISPLMSAATVFPFTVKRTPYSSSVSKSTTAVNGEI